MPPSPELAQPNTSTDEAGLLHTVLTLSLTAIALLRPLYEADGERISDFAWVLLNPAGQRMLGQPAQPADSLLMLFPNAKADGVFDVCCRAYETNEPQRNETNYQADGLDGYFILAAQRHQELLVVNFTDTNDQPRSALENALRESQAAAQQAYAEVEQQRQRFREVLTQMPAYIAVYQGPDHIYQFVNPAYQSLFPHRSFLGRPFREGTPESVELGVAALFDQVYQTGEPVYLREMEGWFDFHGNGQPVQVFLNISLHPLCDVHGRVDGVLDFTYDVSQQVRARQQVDQLNQELETRVQQRTAQLAEQQGILRQILSTVPAAIATLSGPEHRFSFANDRYQYLVGHRVRMGLSVSEALPEAVEQGVIELLDRVYQTGEPFIGTEIMIMLEQPPGPPHHYAYNLAYLPLHDGQGQVQGILVFAVEVNEQVQARRKVQHLNQQLHTANARLTRTNADLDTFIYTASHDLKAPITNIEGLIHALRHELSAQSISQEAVAQLLHLVDDSITRFQRTLGYLTEAVQSQQAGRQWQEGEADVASLIEGVRLDLAPALQATQAQVTVEVHCGPVRCSPKDVRSIVYNLLSNALKYCAPEVRPLVQVQAHCADKWLELRVQDNGLGLTPAQQSSLFGLFQRLHPHIEGSGIGLYSIKKLIDNAGGTIEVESAVGSGSTFTVRLPLAPTFS
jgi:signal transduction histidine kinase